MINYNQGASAQTVSHEEYRLLDNRVTCILQQRWPAIEISQWVRLLQGKQQAIACAILRCRHPRPSLLALPAIDQSGTIRCTITGRTLFITPSITINHTNPE